MSKSAVLIRKSTGEILKHGEYPNVDMTPVVGLDPDLEWLLKHEPHSAPDYDPRIFKLEINEEVTDEDHPEHEGIKMYKRTYGTVKRSNEEIIRQIENAEESANRELMTYRTDDKLFMLAIGVLTRKNEGIEPSDAEKEILDKVKSFDEKIWKNNATKLLKKQQVENNEEPEIDEGWEKE